jgi:small-conductance mechanosensitive channel
VRAWIPHSLSIVLAALVVAAWWPGDAGAQALPLPGLTGQGDRPELRFADDPRGEVERVRRGFVDAQQGLLLRGQDVDAWTRRRDEVRARLAELRAERGGVLLEQEPSAAARRFGKPPPAPPPVEGEEAPPPPEPPLLDVLRFGEAFLAPGVHPAEARSLDAAIEVAEAVEARLAQLLRIYSEERAVVADGISRADALLDALSPGAGAEDEDEDKRFWSLYEAEQALREAELARIELSLATARERRSEEIAASDEEAGSGGQAEAVAPLAPEPLTPAQAYSDSLTRAEALRTEQITLREELQTYTAPLFAVGERLDELRARRRRLELMIARRTLATAEERSARAQDKIRITEDEIAEAEGRRARSQDLRARSIPKLEAALQALDGGGGEGGFGPFSPARVAEIRRTALTERIAFERLKLERDRFRAALTREMRLILSGEPPRKAFVKAWGDLVEAGAIPRRIAELEKRCDGWRRAEKRVSGESPPAALADSKPLILKAYAEIADVCMRTEWVYGTMGRYSQLAQFELKKLAARERGFSWYLWRALVTGLFLFIAYLISRRISEVSHRFAQGGLEDEDREGGEAKGAPRLVRGRPLLGLSLYLLGAGGAWAAAALLALNFVWDIELGGEKLAEWATHPLFLVGDNEVSAWSLLQVAVWTVLSFWAGRATQRLLSDNLLKHFAIERGVRDAVGTIARYLVIVAGLATGLSIVGIGLGALAVVAGVVGIGIGFGLQNIANNFISGFIILLERPIRKGDFVQVGEMIGEVINISARATTIETRDAVSVVVPNSEFISGRVVNWTLGHDERVRAQVEVGVAYGSDLHLVREVLLRVARMHKDVLSDPPPAVDMVGFGDSSLDFNLHVWTRRLRTLPGLLSELNLAVDDAFRARGIEIPFPQRDVHLYRTAPDDDDDDDDPGGSLRGH